MTVKQLIKELLDMPMDNKVELSFVDDEYERKYKDIHLVIHYEDDNVVGLLD